LFYSNSKIQFASEGSIYVRGLKVYNTRHSVFGVLFVSTSRNVIFEDCVISGNTGINNFATESSNVTFIRTTFNGT
jgi:hypothetical protein